MNQFNIINANHPLHCFKKISSLRQVVWPNFLKRSDEIMLKIYELYPEFQLSLLDADTHELLGIANSIPFVWQASLSQLSDDGVSWMIDKALDSKNYLNSANMLCAISVTISKQFRNKGISQTLLTKLKQIALNHEMTHLVVPVRPNLKSEYPLIPIENYVTWKNAAGDCFDPWLRTHLKLGAQILKICYRSACVSASIQQWKEWTELSFPGDGNYLIKDALAPITINYENNIGTYIEPNVWVSYDLTNAQL